MTEAKPELVAVPPPLAAAVRELARQYAHLRADAKPGMVASEVHVRADGATSFHTITKRVG